MALKVKQKKVVKEQNFIIYFERLVTCRRRCLITNVDRGSGMREKRGNAFLFDSAKVLDCLSLA